ncbi:MAG: hypothetical protein ABGY96_24585 [bacterium]
MRNNVAYSGMTDARSPRAPVQHEKVRSDAASPVNFERDSGQERRVVRGQEEHRLGDVLMMQPPPRSRKTGSAS